tara:strand:+ start:181 stop:447 length:267 start_codon:yes stop_codon:yes gene_type:complete
MSELNKDIKTDNEIVTAIKNEYINLNQKIEDNKGLYVSPNLMKRLSGNMPSVSIMAIGCSDKDMKKIARNIMSLEAELREVRRHAANA